METTAIDKYADIIDSRDVIARIEYLQAAWDESTGESHEDYALSEDDWSVGLSDDDAHELVALMELAEDGESLPDWQYGESLIRDSYFEDYARELAEDIFGKLPSGVGWPAYCIDWARAARELQTDYTTVEFDGEQYWARA